ncbi:MAG: ABC transporter ATP-binding protein [Paracoccaceae bacterium]|jgi:branched-chain amino acid transport system ATP-binding protein|nr:ABC transporter ATP-binding protein [Paracoccaceae bacterium]MDP5345093.1 ABC transporter ATP-binding protein [Paracoccaceae bacterium]
MSVVLSAQGLRKSYGALTVTDNLSLDLHQDELLAVIGPNGAGKTTLINQLSGQLRPDAGRVVLAGRDISDQSMAQRVHLGMARTFQITSILPGFSVLENVALAVQARSGSSFRFFRAAAGQRRLNDAAMAHLAEVDLDADAQRRAADLSHGKQRQLELAIALATDPHILLLDEPLAGTGGAEAARLVALMQRLKARHSILLIEHDMRAVFALADRIAVMVYGQIIATGTPDEIRANPRVRAAYLGQESV